MKNKILLTALTVALTSGAGFAYKAYADEKMEHKEMMMHDDMKSHDHANMDHNKIMKEGEVMGKGVINSVNLDEKKINMTHNPIPSLGWPAMTMDFVVSDDVDLKSIEKGEDVMFHMVLGDDKVYRITKIMKSDDKMEHEGMDHEKMEHKGMNHKDKDHEKMMDGKMKHDDHNSDAHKH